MNKEYRMITAAFQERMTAESAWPREKALKTWFNDHGLPYRSGSYFNIRERRQPVEIDYLIGLIRFMLDVGEEQKYARRCLLLHLGHIGVEYPGNQSPQKLLEHLCDPPLPSPRHITHMNDFIRRGPLAIMDLLHTKRFIDHNVQRCDSGDMLREAVGWFFAVAGHFESEITLPPKIAIRAAEHRLKISVDEYQSFAAAFQDRHPWTVVMARGSEKPTGVSIILPLREDIYMKVRNGELTSFRCDPNDFEIPSRHLLLEVVSQRPESMKGEPTEGATKALLWCIFSQIAALSRFSTAAGNKPLHLLGIDGAADTKERLDAYGFKATGSRMPGTNEKLYERIIYPHLKGRDLTLLAILTMLSVSINGLPPS